MYDSKASLPFYYYPQTMKRLLRFSFALCLIAALVGCDKFDDRQSNEKITINGKTYKVHNIFGYYGGWNDDYNSGDFTLTVEEDRNEGTWITDYFFYFRSQTCPQVGYNFAKLALKLDPPYDGGDDFSYRDGDLIILSRDKNGSEMTLHFVNLVMARGSETYVFNGKATVPFDFYPDL